VGEKLGILSERSSMLHSLEDVTGVSVIATDGEIGKVRDFLFDDQTWKLRYFVVDVGSWLKRRDVVISVSAIDQPDWAGKTFRAHLTKEQVKHSPDVDSTKPVSRQEEIAMNKYFGWPDYWDTAGAFGEISAASVPPGRDFAGHAKENPHLRSAEDMAGYAVWAEEGEIGRLDAFIVDEASWHIGYLDVKTGDWLHRRSMLVPTRWVESVSWPDHRVNLRHARHRD
jgi:uncharacterized protein YrrD